MTCAVMGACNSASASIGDFNTVSYNGSGATQSVITGVSSDLVMLIGNSRPFRSYDATNIGGYTMFATSYSEDNNGITSFDNAGFTLRNTSGSNVDGINYQAFAWKQAAGYAKIVRYTGSVGTAKYVNHDMLEVPALMLVRGISNPSQTYVYHKSLGANKYLLLNNRNIPANSPVAWNNTAPSAASFRVGSSLNGNGTVYQAWLFAEKAGSSKIDSYTGLNAVQEIECGFKPKLLIATLTTVTGGGWYIIYDDGTMVKFNIDGTTSIDSDASGFIEFTATGFKLTGTDINNNGSNYIFAAWG